MASSYFAQLSSFDTQMDDVSPTTPHVFMTLGDLEREPEIETAVRAEVSPSKLLPVHETIRQKLDAFYTSNKIPHIIFHGASGTGKLSIVHEFIHRIYQGDKQRIKTSVMTVNCSHGKGIKFIRDELKFFAKTNIQTNSGVLFKTILLINAHHLTIDAQSALRRCIELFSYNTRFFIVLENKNKLLNPILSRFCEIYVPEHIDESGEVVNLHQYALVQKYDFSSQKTEHREYIHSRLNHRQCTSTWFSDLAEELYYRGISCLDLMGWFEEHRAEWTEAQYSNIVLCFHRIKTEFRCEKMLMFYLLDYAFCSDFVLPNV